MVLMAYGAEVDRKSKTSSLTYLHMHPIPYAFTLQPFTLVGRGALRASLLQMLRKLRDKLLDTPTIMLRVLFG